MASLPGVDRYQQLQVESAAPNQLVLMLYEGAVRFLREAREYMAAKQYELQSQRIQRAQRVLNELMYALDPSVDAELVRSLRAFYGYVHTRLVWANVRSDLQMLDEAISLLEEMLEAWEEADQRCRLGTPMRRCA